MSEELELFAGRRKPRFAIGEWVYWDEAKGPVLLRGYTPSGYLLTRFGDSRVFYGMPHMVHKFTKRLSKAWEKRK